MPINPLPNRGWICPKPCSSVTHPVNHRRFGLGGEALLGVPGSILLCFLQVLDSKLAILPTPQLWGSRDPARGSPPPAHTTALRLWEPGGALGSPCWIWTFPGCLCFTQQPGVQGYPQEQPLDRTCPSHSLSSSQTFQHFIPARALSWAGINEQFHPCTPPRCCCAQGQVSREAGESRSCHMNIKPEELLSNILCFY